MFIFLNNPDMTDQEYNSTTDDSIREETSFMEESLSQLNMLRAGIMVILGLIGHCLTVMVYSKRINRTNSSHVYMLCLALVDSSFLLIHIFEDTIPTINAMVDY